MNNRQYYYLIAGLPDLTHDMFRPPVSVAVFLQTLHERLHAEDFAQVELLLLPADNHNLLQLLQDPEFQPTRSGTYPLTALRTGIQEPEILPAYMQRFVAAYREQEPIFPNMSWENQLAWLFYDHILETTEGFLHAWFSFDRDLRNLLAGLSARRCQLSIEGQLIGSYALTAAIRQSHVRDFGMTGEHPYLEDLLELEHGNWLERESGLDRLRWQFLDELLAFHYFSLEPLLAYLIKLMLLERWQTLEEETGAERFRQLTESLENSIQFPQEYALA